MAIRFACANCGKYHRIGDEHAGKSGRCGRCKARFVAPGVPKPVNSTVFVPAATPDLWGDDRPIKRVGGVRGSIGFGLGLAALALVVMFHFRDRIEAFAPGMAPALPPKAIRHAAPVVAPIADQDWWDSVARSFGQTLGVAYLLIAIIAPIVVPPILSRFHFLSVGRWLIMATLAAIIGVMSFVLVLSVFATPNVPPNPIQFVAILTWWPAMMAFFGCMVAAAIYPKTTPGGA